MDGAAIFSDMDALVVAARELHLIERPHADLDLDLLAVVIHRDAWAAAWANRCDAAPHTTSAKL